MRTRRPARMAPEWLDKLVTHEHRPSSRTLSPAAPGERVVRAVPRSILPSFDHGSDLRPIKRPTAKNKSADLNRIAS